MGYDDWYQFDNEYGIHHADKEKLLRLKTKIVYIFH